MNHNEKKKRKKKGEKKKKKVFLKSEVIGLHATEVKNKTVQPLIVC